MADLTPVVGDPFAGPVLAPVSGDPFAGQPSPFDKAPPTFADSPFASSGTLSSYEPNAADRLRVDASQGLQGLGASRGYADSFGTGLANVVSNSPLGAGMQAQDASRDFGQGNYTGAMLNGLGAAAALVPVGGSGVGAAERAAGPAIKGSFEALHSRSIPDFLSANNIPFESASSSSISDRFGPSASNYYNIIDNTGTKKTLRISDHSYGQNNSGDFRYGEPEAIAFEKVLNIAGRDVPDNIAIASADARISQSQSAIDGLNSIIAKGAPFPIGGKSALKDQIRNHSAIISSAQAKKDALVANAAADSEPAVADAASKAINWDRSTVASGWPPMAGSQVVDVPVDAMEKAFQANKSQYVAKPNDAIMDHIAAGMPVSLPEVSASHGALNFQNGRNRFAAARDLGADTVPVSTDDPTALWNVLGKHGAAGSDLHATMLKRASDITLTPVSGNPFEGQ